MESELLEPVLIAATITAVSTTVLAIITFGIAINNRNLTINTEKFSRGNLIINLQDKLSAAILPEQDIQLAQK